MNELKKLLKVKSLVTLILTLIFAVQVLRGQVPIEQVYLIVISFYFGTQLKSDKEG